MFCGGVFACKPDSEDLFVCSDGVEMNQNELLNIVRGVLSLLHVNPLEPNSRKVLFVEAANTYIRHYRGYIFGASTYHNMSVPLLTSTMERVINCASAIYGGSGDIDLQEYNSRSSFFHCIRQLISNTPGAAVPPSLARTFNAVSDMTMNTGASYQMEPKASGDFQTTAAVPEEPSSRGDESNTENSNTDNSNQSSEINFPSSSGIPENLTVEEIAKSGSIAVKLTQNVSFAVKDNTTMFNVEVENTLKMSAIGGSECGPLLFAVIPATLVNEARFNSKLLEEDPNGIYKCEKPLEQIPQLTKVLLFNSTIPQESLSLPFIVERTFVKNGSNCKITVSLSSKYVVQGILIGFNSAGFENARSDDCDVSIGGPNVLLSLRGIADESGGETSASVIGDVADDYIPPVMLQTRCTLRGVSLGNISVKTHPEYNFKVKVMHQKLFVSRSAWELPVQ